MWDSSCWARNDSPPSWSPICYLCKYVGLSVPYWGNNWKQGNSACVGVCVLLPAQIQHPPLTKTGLARSGMLRKEENHQNLSLFSPQALAKIQRHRFAFIRRCGGDHGGFQSWTTKIPFCLFTKSTGCSEKCLCAGLVRGSLNYSRSS